MPQANFNQLRTNLQKASLTHKIDSQWIVNSRGPKNEVPLDRPYACLIERERAASGAIDNIGTIFLSNKECPFRCLMCDLWKNTTHVSITTEQLLDQLDFAVQHFRNECAAHSIQIQQWKLYNSGNFFDTKAIPPSAIPQVVDLINGESNRGELAKLIIECHPKLVDHRCLKFAADLRTELEVAMGLETVHPEILPQLNKQMTLGDFQQAVERMLDQNIDVRAFILLRPPFLTEAEGIDWAIRSIEWAFQIGVNCCAVIPTRTGNGSLEQLESKGLFREPELSSLEQVLDAALGLAGSGNRVFVDLWDAKRFSSCHQCVDERILRLNQMNLNQQVLPKVECKFCMVRD